MTMRFGSLLLLVFLCSAETEWWYGDPAPLPKELDAIDLAKCTAIISDTKTLTPEEKKEYWPPVSYQCFMQDGCIDKEKDFVPVGAHRIAKDWKTKDSKKKCGFGYSMRPITKTAWEIEIQFAEKKNVNGDDIYHKFELTLYVYEWLNVDDQIKDDDGHVQFTPSEKYFLIFAANNSNYDVAHELYGELAEVEIQTDHKSRIKDGKYLHDFRTEIVRKGINYIRFVLKATDAEFGVVKSKHMYSAEGVFKYISGSDANFLSRKEVKTGDIRPISAYKYPRFTDPCPDLKGIFVREAIFMPERRSNKPREAFDHNVHDFSQMCESQYRPFLTKSEDNYKEVTSMDCVNNKLTLTHPVGTPSEFVLTPENMKNFPLEITCQTLQDDCTYCEKPDWAIPPLGFTNSSHFEGALSNMSYTPGAMGKCAVLKCDDGLPFYYPQIGFTSNERPECEFDREDGKFKWTISERSDDYWYRPRVPLTSGYCMKRTNACIPLPASMTSCPRGSGGCQKPKMIFGGLVCGDFSLSLHFSYSRRFALMPVESITCDNNTGQYVVTMRGGDTYSNFDDETWIVCKEPRHFPMYTDEPLIKRDPMLKSFIGFCMGSAAFLVTVAVLVGTSIVVVKTWAFFATTLAKRVKVKVEVEMPDPEKDDPNGLNAEVRKAFAPGPEKPVILLGPKKPQPSIDYLASPAVATMRIAVKAPPVKKSEGGVKKGGKFVFTGFEEQTCIEPDADEMLLIKEEERLNEGTDDEDATGKDVKEIQKED